MELECHFKVQTRCPNIYTVQEGVYLWANWLSLADIISEGADNYTLTTKEFPTSR